MSKAYAWVLVSYAAASAAAVWAFAALPELHPVARVFAADIAATLVIFAFSFAFRNSSFYDPYWSVVPPVIAVYWAWVGSAAGADGLRQALVIGLVSLWGVRLTFNWCRGWTGLEHEDWRYVDLREKTGRAYWGVSFAGIHMMPTLWVFGGCLSLWPALAVGTRAFGVFDVAAVVIVAGAIALEARADAELARFRRSDRDPEDILRTGVWAWSRHPNYFGEMSFWWGLFLFGFAADPSYWWTAAGPLAITLMFRFISLPMMEERMAMKRPAFAAHQRHSSLVVPWPPGRGAATALVACVVGVALLSTACSKPVRTVHTDVFLRRFEAPRAECIRATVKPAILESLLEGILESPAGTDVEAKLSVVSGCADPEDLLRGVAQVVVAEFPNDAAPYGIGAVEVPETDDEIREWMEAYPFDLAGRSRYRGVERRLAGRYMVAYRAAGGLEPVHELMIEDVRTSGLRPEGWRAEDIVGSIVLEAGADDVDHGRDKDVVWAVVETGAGDEARTKVVWGTVGDPLVFSLEGSEDELMSAIVEELAMRGRS